MGCAALTAAGAAGTATEAAVTTTGTAGRHRAAGVRVLRAVQLLPLDVGAGRLAVLRGLAVWGLAAARLAVARLAVFRRPVTLVGAGGRAEGAVHGPP